MFLSLETAWLLGLFYTATRLAGALVLTPIFAFSTLPARIRVMFVLVLSAALMTVPTVPAPEWPATSAALLAGFLTELLFGAALGFGIHAVFAAFMFGGRVLDFQIGFAVANIFDPTSQVQAPLMGTFLQMLGVVVFLAMDAHHTLIQGLAFTLETVPPGGAGLSLSPGPFVSQFGLLFVYGVMLVAPAIIGLLFLDIAIAVVARTMPQVNVYFVSLPLKVFLGLLLTAISLRYLGPLMEKMFRSIFEFWRLLALG